jgi:hypothetical protein
MIQRIQSVYLLLVAFLFGLMLWLPLSVHRYKTGNIEVIMLNKLTNQADAGFTVDSRILHTEMALVLITLVLAVFTIFQFRNRKRQLLLCKATLLSISATIGVLFIVVDFQLKKGVAGPDLQSTFLPAAYGPLFSLFLVYLAIRGIRKDDELVRSADRLR